MILWMLILENTTRGKKVTSSQSQVMRTPAQLTHANNIAADSNNINSNNSINTVCDPGLGEEDWLSESSVRV